MPVHAIVPVRLDSRRFPRKSLMRVNQRPLLAWLLDSILSTRLFTSVIVTSPDVEVLALAEAQGALAHETKGRFRNGTHRVAETAVDLKLDTQSVVNIQGDMVGVEPKALSSLIDELRAAPTSAVTIARKCHSSHELTDPNRVKVVWNRRQEALYFSRSLIPHGGDIDTTHVHVGVYGFPPNTLEEYVGSMPTTLASTEDLEQLDWLVQGRSIKVVKSEWSPPCIDVEEDLASAEDWLESGGVRT